MNSPLIKVRAGAFDVVAIDGRIRVVRRRDGAAVGTLPLVDEPTFGDALKEAVSRAASSNVETPVPASPEAEPKKKRRSKRSTSKAEPTPAEPVAAPEPDELSLEKRNDEKD